VATESIIQLVAAFLAGVVLPVLHSKGYKFPIVSAILDLFTKKPTPTPVPLPSPDLPPVPPSDRPLLDAILKFLDAELRKRLPIESDQPATPEGFERVEALVPKAK
jgi:hypothetical protein